MVIEGHTDSVGTDLYNLGLGQRRAEVVMGCLVPQHQVEPKRLSPLSYGESRPIADNRTADGRALNRRVEFKVLVRWVGGRVRRVPLSLERAMPMSSGWPVWCQRCPASAGPMTREKIGTSPPKGAGNCLTFGGMPGRIGSGPRSSPVLMT